MPSEAALHPPPTSPLTGAWVRHWRGRPSAPVLVEPGSGAAVTAAELEERTAEAARRLARVAVQPGDPVVLSAASSVDLVVVHVALLRMGAVVVPIGTGATRREWEHVVAEVNPVAVVTDQPQRFTGAAALVTTPDLPLPGGATPALDATPGSARALVDFTSGTTGRPKGAVHTHASLAAGASSVVEAWEWRSDDRLVLALPLFHMHGLGVGLHGTLTAGASAVLLPRFAAAAVVAAARERQATLLFGVPTMYAQLMREPDAAALADLRLLVSGSAPLAPDLFDTVQRTTGHAPLERYGMTETVMLTSNPLHGERRRGSVGLPLPGVEVRLGEADVVEVRGPNVFSGYWEREAETREAFTEDGWFRTGDIGRFDDDGYLRLVGRASELIISGGYNVYPREVEDVLRTVDGVADVAVVGVPDSEWGELVTVVVVGDAADAALQAAADTGLAAYKRPRRWVRAEVLPRNAMGKVQRGELVEGLTERD